MFNKKLLDMISGRFNTRPEGWEELEYNEIHMFFSYMLKPYEFRQIYYDENYKLQRGTFNTMLFELNYNDAEGLGYAIINDWKEKRVRFFKFGDPEKWKTFSGNFAAQFRGDNS